MIEQKEEQVQMSGVDGVCGRTFQAPLVQTKARTSGKSYKRSSTSPAKKSFMYLSRKSGLMQEASWMTPENGQLPGESWMLNSGESPNVVAGSTLSQILQEQAPQKYCLSRKACAGIINRAERRGKELPPMLKEALLEVINSDEQA